MALTALTYTFNSAVAGAYVTCAARKAPVFAAGAAGPYVYQVDTATNTVSERPVTNRASYSSQSNGIALSPDGVYLAYGYYSAGGTFPIFKWDGSAYNFLTNIVSVEGESYLSALDFNDAGDRLAVVCHSSIQIWQRSGDSFTRLSRAVPAGWSQPESVKWSKSGEFVAVGGRGGSLILHVSSGGTVTQIFSTTAMGGWGAGWTADDQHAFFSRVGGSGTGVIKHASGSGASAVFTDLVNVTGSGGDVDSTITVDGVEYLVVHGYANTAVSVFTRSGDTYTSTTAAAIGLSAPSSGTVGGINTATLANGDQYFWTVNGSSPYGYIWYSEAPALPPSTVTITGTGKLGQSAVVFNQPMVANIAGAGFAGSMEAELAFPQFVRAEMTGLLGGGLTLFDNSEEVYDFVPFTVTPGVATFFAGGEVVIDSTPDPYLYALPMRGLLGTSAVEFKLPLALFIDQEGLLGRGSAYVEGEGEIVAPLTGLLGQSTVILQKQILEIDAPLVGFLPTSEIELDAPVGVYGDMIGLLGSTEIQIDKETRTINAELVGFLGQSEAEIALTGFSLNFDMTGFLPTSEIDLSATTVVTVDMVGFLGQTEADINAPMGVKIEATGLLGQMDAEFKYTNIVDANMRGLRGRSAVVLESFYGLHLEQTGFLPVSATTLYLYNGVRIEQTGFLAQSETNLRLDYKVNADLTGFLPTSYTDISIFADIDLEMTGLLPTSEIELDAFYAVDAQMTGLLPSSAAEIRTEYFVNAALEGIAGMSGGGLLLLYKVEADLTGLLASSADEIRLDYFVNAPMTGLLPTADADIAMSTGMVFEMTGLLPTGEIFFDWDQVVLVQMTGLLGSGQLDLALGYTVNADMAGLLGQGDAGISLAYRIEADQRGLLAYSPTELALDYFLSGEMVGLLGQSATDILMFAMVNAEMRGIAARSDAELSLFLAVNAAGRGLLGRQNAFIWYGDVPDTGDNLGSPAFGDGGLSVGGPRFGYGKKLTL